MQRHHKYVWYQETKEQRSIIDYIITKQKHTVTVEDTRVLKRLEYVFNHNTANVRTESLLSYEITEKSAIKQESRERKHCSRTK